MSNSPYSRQRVLPGAALAFATGIAGARLLQAENVGIPFTGWFGAAACAGALVLVSLRWGLPQPRMAGVLALVCLVCVGGGAAEWQLETRRRASATLSAMSPLVVLGRLDTASGQWRFTPERVCAAAAPDRCLAGRPSLALWWRSRAGGRQSPQPTAGLVMAQGEFIAPQRPANPGEYDPLAAAEQSGVAGELLVTQWRQMDTAQSWIARVRDRWAAEIRQAVPGETGVLLQSLTLGGSSGLSPETKQALQRAGLAHVTSVSGLHVALVASSIWLLCGGRVGARGWAGVLAGGLFALLSGGKPPAWRATLCLAVAVLAGSRGRKADPWTGLAVAWLALLALNPALLTNAGFGLSFSSVAGILAIARPLLRQPASVRLVDRIGAHVWNSLAVSVGAQAGAAYITAQTFGTLPVLGALTNLACVPLATMALLVSLGGLLLCAVPGLQGLGTEALQAAGWCAGLFLHIANMAGGAPWSVVELPVLPAWAGIAWLSILCACALWLQQRRLPFIWRCMDNRIPGWLLMAALGVAGCQIVHAQSRGQMRITFLSVGQGDAILIQTPAGAVLVDAGGSGRSRDASHIILPQLRRRGIRRLALLVSTHPHADHLGGMAEIILSRPPRLAVDTGATARSNTYREYREALRRAAVPYRTMGAGDVVELGGVRLEALWPPGGRGNLSAGGDVNAGSLVLRVSYGEVAALLTGDVTADVQAELLRSKAPLQAALMKASHQGAASSFHAEFVAAVSPEVSVVSVGPNQYGHPAPHVINALQQIGTLCRTDADGAVEFTTDGRRWRVQSMRGTSCRASGQATDRRTLP